MCLRGTPAECRASEWQTMNQSIRAILLTIGCTIPAWAADDPREIIRRSLQFHTQNDEAARNYTFLRRVDIRALDGAGKVRHNDCKTWDVTLLEGSPYTRLVMRDDKPL